MIQVVEILVEAFPELQKDPQMVMDVSNEEEKQFLVRLPYVRVAVCVSGH